jgi:ribonuclease Z
MRPSFSPDLVNGPSGDPTLYVDFKFEGRALMFDLGEIGALAPRKLLRLSDVFVSHAHMDHFCGFDRLLRICLGRETAVRLYGPPGFIDRVEHRLAGYTWNLVHNYPTDFTLLVHELSPELRLRGARFRCHARFAREPLAERAAPGGVLLEEPGFRVRAALLHHDTPCLGFALEEKAHVNVWRNRIAELGLEVGPWLNELKRMAIEGAPDDEPVRARWRDAAGPHERRVPLGELKARALRIVPGEKLCYVTDVLYSEDNARRVAALAADADRLYIECVFLEEDADHAARKFHLTASQAGRIARAAGAKLVIPFHFSPRYGEREAELRAELERARAGEGPR